MPWRRTTVYLTWWQSLRHVCFACLGFVGVLRDNPFTGSLPVLPQYSTAQYSPLGQTDYLRQPQTESDWVRQPQTAFRPQYRPFPALYRLFPVVLPSVQYYPLFPERTSFSTVLPGPFPGTRYLPGPCTTCPRLCTASSTVLQSSPPTSRITWSRLPPDFRWDITCHFGHLRHIFLPFHQLRVQFRTSGFCFFRTFHFLF